MDYETAIKEIIFKNLPADQYRVFVFGSRVKKTNRKWSDYDIGILGQTKVPGSALAKIEDELENSDIPCKVDVVDFARVSDKFKDIALKK